MLVRQFISTNFRQPREQGRLTAIACEMSDGLDQGTLDDVFQGGGVQRRSSCDERYEPGRAILEEIIKRSLIACAHSRNQCAIRFVHPVTSFALIGQGCEVRRRANHKSIACRPKSANRSAKRLAGGLWNTAKAVAILRHAEIDSQIV
jgi:hypothetical protein